MSSIARGDDGLHLVLFPLDLGAGDPVDAAVREGARALTLDTAGFVRPAGLLSVALACVGALESGVALTLNRARSSAADSYLERVGFYDLVVGHGGSVKGIPRTVTTMEPLTGLLELPDDASATRGIADCVKRLVDFGCHQVDSGRIEEALTVVLLGVLHDEKRGSFFVAERYADEAGWTRVEVGMGSRHSGLSREEWDRLDQALVAWSAQQEIVVTGPLARLVEQTLQRGPGAFELRSGTRIVSVSTRSGASGRSGIQVAGTRVGLILNVAPPSA